jgi:hypothetical protein
MPGSSLIVAVAVANLFHLPPIPSKPLMRDRFRDWYGWEGGYSGESPAQEQEVEYAE